MTKRRKDPRITIRFSAADLADVEAAAAAVSQPIGVACKAAVIAWARATLRGREGPSGDAGRADRRLDASRPRSVLPSALVVAMKAQVPVDRARRWLEHVEGADDPVRSLEQLAGVRFGN